jgi:hypothetical protein
LSDIIIAQMDNRPELLKSITTGIVERFDLNINLEESDFTDKQQF